MKNILFVVILALGLTACEKEVLRGSGNIVKETRTVGLFDNIHLNGSNKVTVNYAPNQKVEVEGYGNLVAAYDVYVSNGTLILEFKHTYFNIRNNNLNVIISTPYVQDLSVNGSGKAIMNSGFPALNNVSFFVNGSGRIETGSFPVNNMVAKVSGSGEANINAIAFDAEANVSGSGSLSINATNKLIAHVSGSGSIDYYGNPVNVQTSVSGSGRIRKK
jgi:hypothetical protein